MKSSATLKALSLATVLIYLHDCMNLSVETCLVSGYEASQPVSFRSIRQVVPASHEIRTVGTACLYFKTSIQGYRTSGIASFSLHHRNGLLVFVFRHVIDNQLPMSESLK